RRPTCLLAAGAAVRPPAQLAAARAARCRADCCSGGDCCDACPTPLRPEFGDSCDRIAGHHATGLPGFWQEVGISQDHFSVGVYIRQWKSPDFGLFFVELWGV